MFRPFRRRRHPDPSPPPETEQADFDQAWADYVEWSGLDEDRLPETDDDQ